VTNPFIAALAGTGSYPIDRRTAIPLVNQRLGNYQLWHQQGETERPQWLLEILRRLLGLRGMRVSGGNFESYTGFPEVEYDGATLDIPAWVLDISSEMRQAAEVLVQMYGQHWQRPVLAGFPMPTMDFVEFAFLKNPRLQAAFKEACAKVSLEEINTVYQALGSYMVLCLESPGSLVGMHMAQTNGANLQDAAWRIAGEFVEFARRLPRELPLALHLCRGDLGHQSWFGRIDSLEPMVVLANSIAHRFAGAGMSIPTMFLPTCAGDVAPSLDEQFFRPLHDLSSQIPVILANVHEMRTLDPDISLEDAIAHNLRSTEMATRALGWPGQGTDNLPVAVSFSCGGARMDPMNWQFGLDVQAGMANAAGLHGPVTPL